MDFVKMSRGAKVLVEVLAQVKKGEQVILLCDTDTVKIGEALAAQVWQLEALPILLIIPPLSEHGAALPEIISGMVREADVLIAPMKTNIAHTSTRRSAQDAGARIMVLPEADVELLSSPAMLADFHELRPKIEHVAGLLTRADEAVVTARGGTDIRMSIAGRNGRALTGFVQPDDISAGPCLEASLAPVEGSAEGVIVADVSIPGIGLLTDPVRIEVRDGFGRDISGGAEAKKFRDLLTGLNDPNVYNIAELGIGMNPNCRATGSMLLDEGTSGTIHIALGTNAYIGGKVKAAGHFDVLIANPDMRLDGRLVIENGVLVG